MHALDWRKLRRKFLEEKHLAALIVKRQERFTLKLLGTGTPAAGRRAGAWKVFSVVIITAEKSF